MSVKNAVLGLLSERRGYGYDLVQRLEARLGPAWQLSPSAVYAALDQLEARGQVRGVQLDPRGEEDGRLARRSARITYEITDAGIAAFDKWMARPSERHEPVRSELQLKMAVARTVDQPLLIEAITHQARLTEALLSQFSPVDGCADIVRRAATARLQSDLVWLEEVRECLAETCDVNR